MLSTPHPLDACWRFRLSFSQKKTGFSLIEMLVYLSLFSVVALAIMAFYGYFLSASIDNRDRAATGFDRAWVNAALASDLAADASTEHCLLLPSPPRFSDANVPIAMIAITASSHEAEKDWLGFSGSGIGEAETITTQGISKQIITYDSILFNGQPVWPLAAADFEPATGLLRICSSHGSGCTSALASNPTADQWRQALSTITYQARSTPNTATKTIRFALGFPVSESFTTRIDTSRFFTYCQQAVSLPPNFE